MFDIGFPELVLVSIVALLVIGPDKLPETIRTVSLWIGRVRRSFASIKAEIENEIGADDIRRELHNEAIMKELDSAKNQINQGLRDTENELRGMTRVSEVSDEEELETAAIRRTDTATLAEAEPATAEQENPEPDPAQAKSS